MLWLQRSFITMAAFFLGAGLLWAPAPAALAQSTGQGAAVPTPDQIEIFRNLTPEQQDAILKQLGGSGSGGSLGGLGGLGGLSSSGTDRQSTSDRQEQNQANDQAGNGSGDQQQQRGGIPVIRADEWVIIEIDFHLAARPLSPTAQAFYANQLATAQSPQAPPGQAATGLQQTEWPAERQPAITAPGVRYVDVGY
jgi:hypothetical protein